QRLGIARVILEAPDYLFLDEATASLDEPAEAALYRLLDERLKGTTIVSIGHRSTLSAFHRRGLAMTRDGDRFRVRAAVLDRAQSRPQAAGGGSPEPPPAIRVGWPVTSGSPLRSGRTCRRRRRSSRTSSSRSRRD